MKPLKWQGAEPGYYVTAWRSDGQKTALVSGPFKTRREAIADVPRVRNAWFETSDYDAAFAAWGTCRIKRPVGAKRPDRSLL